MDYSRLQDSFLEMTKIASPSYSEKKMANYCKLQLESMGFTVQEDNSAEKTGSDTGNLIAHLQGNSKGHIAFCSHMDTVVPCENIEAEIKTAKFGDSESAEIICSKSDTILSADDKAGIAAIFEGIRSALENNAPRPDITVVLTTCEEMSLVGASALADDTFKGETPCFVLDADGAPGSIIVSAPFHYTLKASFKGKPAHAGVAPETGRSAIEAAAAAIRNMELGRIDQSTTANIGLISGGAAVNIVAEECVLEGECRSLYEDSVLIQKSKMTKALEKAAKDTETSVEIEWYLDYPGIMFTEEDDIVIHLINASKRAGLEPSLIASGGGADANILATKGACAITLGIGMTNFHSKDEYIKVEDLEGSARLVEAIIAEYTS